MPAPRQKIAKRDGLKGLWGALNLHNRPHRFWYAHDGAAALFPPKRRVMIAALQTKPLRYIQPLDRCYASPTTIPDGITTCIQNFEKARQ